MSTSAPPRTDLSLTEMLHVLDVARTLRRDSEIVAAELNQEQFKSSLRERLLASAALAGDRVTPAEVDAAIEIYYQNLHTYADPPRSWGTLFAHLYVRRTMVLAGVLLCLTVVGASWWLFWSEGAWLSAARRGERVRIQQQVEAESTATRFVRQLESARSVADDPVAKERLAKLEHEADVAIAAQDASAIERLTGDVIHLEARLREVYDVLVVTGPGRRSGVDRGFGDKSSGYYLIVEARTPDGRVIPRSVTSRETGEVRRVTAWGEQVPQAVYERIGRDKAEDGTVDDRLFAVKRAGWLEEELRMVGPNESPLTRGGQITAWDE